VVGQVPCGEEAGLILRDGTSSLAPMKPHSAIDLSKNESDKIKFNFAAPSGTTTSILGSEN
jgi:hypothetical protein